MTEPSERAKRRACEIFGFVYLDVKDLPVVIRLARHLDAEDKAARDAIGLAGGRQVEKLAALARRHILPESRPTVQDILRKWLMGSELGFAEVEQALRDARLLKEMDCD